MTDSESTLPACAQGNEECIGLEKRDCACLQPEWEVSRAQIDSSIGEDSRCAECGDGGL